MKIYKIIPILLLLLIPIILVQGAKETTTSTTTTTLAPINPALKYIDNLSPTQLAALKTKVINYLSTKFNICISDVNLNPDNYSFRFKNSYFVAIDLTLCTGKKMTYISKYTKFEANLLR